MRSDLCSSHQSVTTQAVPATPQLWFLNFCRDKHEITAPPLVLRVICSPTHDQLRRHNRFRQDTLFPVNVHRSLLPVLGSVPAVPSQALLYGGDGWAATPSTHSTPPSRLPRTPPIVTSRACLCRCAFVLRSHVGRVVYTSLQHDEGVSKRLKHPPLALVRQLLVQLQPGTSLKNGWIASSSRLRGTVTMRDFACARLSLYSSARTSG